MEAGSLVAETLLSSTESAEILCGFGDDMGIELEDYPCRWACNKMLGIDSLLGPRWWLAIIHGHIEICSVALG